MQQRTIDVRLEMQPSADIADGGKVRLGGFAPSLPPVLPTSKEVADSGKVRLGGFSPAL
jgi:hypothetical protein